MEQERLAREQEEKEQAERLKKMKESFSDTTGQWEKDKTQLQSLALQEKKKEAKAIVDAAKELPGARAAAPAGEEKLVAKDEQRDGGKT